MFQPIKLDFSKWLLEHLNYSNHIYLDIEINKDNIWKVLTNLGNEYLDSDRTASGLLRYSSKLFEIIVMDNNHLLEDYEIPSARIKTLSNETMRTSDIPSGWHRGSCNSYSRIKRKVSHNSKWWILWRTYPVASFPYRKICL